MKSKKWTNIAIVSLVLIAVELVLLFVLVLPTMRLNKVYKLLDNGDVTEVKEVYGKLSDGKAEKFGELLPDFATYEVNKFIDGKIEYDELKEVFKTIEKCSKSYSDKLEDAYLNADMIQLKKLYLDAVSIYMEDEYSDDYDEKGDQFYDIMWGYSDDDSYGVSYYENDEVQNMLKAVLEEKYDAFIAGDIDYDTMEAYAEVACDFFEGDSYYYASEIDNDLYWIETYSDAYETAKEYYDNEEYFECIEECDNQILWYFSEDGEGDTTGYYEKFKQLRDDAYEAGKTYYITKAEDLINNGDTYEGEELLKQIEEVYGDDVDTSSVWELTRDAWMTPYVEFMDDWDANVRAAINSGIIVSEYDNIALLSYDDYTPYSIYLYDIDENGTPELMLRADDYIYYIFTYDGSEVIYTGAVKITSLYDGPYMIIECMTPPDGYYGHEFIMFDGKSWSVVEYYLANDDEGLYIVNGMDATVDEAIEEQDRLYDMVRSDYLDYADIEDYEDFIYSYTAD